MKNSFAKHLAAINSGRIDRTNIIGLRKAFNAFEKSRHWGGSWQAPKMTADQYSAAEKAIAARQPVAVGELREGGLKVLRNPRYRNRWSERQQAIIDAPDLRFELARFDWLNAVHCVPVFRAVSAKLGQSFTFRNIPWQTAWTMGEEDGPRIVPDSIQ